MNEKIKPIKDFFSNKKVQNILVIVLLMTIIFVSVSMRVQGINNLKDSTTSEYIPLALDPYYFLRVSETMMENNGTLPEFDEMRQPANIGWHSEISPNIVISIYKFAKLFNSDVSLRYICIISPVIFFVFGIIIFFFLIWLLTKSKLISLISVLFLSFMPSYLYRTMAGFIDHDSIGMLGFFLVMLCFVILLKYLNKDKIKTKTIILLSLLLGLITAFGLAVWVGISKFSLMMIPLGFLILWLIKSKENIKLKENNLLSEYKLFNLIVAYLIWIVSLVIFTTLFGFPVNSIIGLFLNPAGLLTLFVPLLMVVDYLIIKKINEKNTKVPSEWLSPIIFSAFGLGIINFVWLMFDLIKGKRERLIPLLLGTFLVGPLCLITLFLGNKQYKKNPEKQSVNLRIFWSFWISGILGIALLTIKGLNIFSMISSIWSSLLHPFGTGRLGLTVAENSQPFLIDWISTIGSTFFWMFVVGLTFFGIEISKGLNNKKDRIIFICAWVLMFSGILFSRISNTSLFNGTNFISQIFYLFGIIFLLYYLFKFYFEDKLKISVEYIIIFIWTFLMIISARSAIRFFFVITPFVCFAVSFFLVKSFKYFKNNKDELINILLIFLIIIGLVGSIVSLSSFYKTSDYQSKYTGPSANYQWQQAMKFVREETPQGSVFAHWWDYGYWVETLGDRPTIADGGHFQGGFRDHMIGRYLLTNPSPNSAMSFLKSNGVNYLLIDSTDLGKYPAYSKIGGNENFDTFSQIPILMVDNSQIQETKNLTRRFYNGGVGVDEDIIYQGELIPGPSYDEIGNPTFNSAMGGIIFDVSTINNSFEILQPTAIYVNKDKQIPIKLRYIYLNGELIDFGLGIEGVLFILPKVSDSSGGVVVDQFGSALYISPKVASSLFAKLYLMNDPFNEYSKIELAHSQPNPIVSQLNQQVMYLGDFVYYRGFLGPIKIWEVLDNDNILYKEEFTRWVGNFAEFDDLVVTKNVEVLKYG